MLPWNQPISITKYICLLMVPRIFLLTCLLCCEQCRWVFRCRRRRVELLRSPCSWWWLRAARSRWQLLCRRTWPCWGFLWYQRSRCWWCYCCCCCCCLVTGGSNLSWHIYLVLKKETKHTCKNSAYSQRNKSFWSVMWASMTSRAKKRAKL